MWQLSDGVIERNANMDGFDVLASSPSLILVSTPSLPWPMLGSTIDGRKAAMISIALMQSHASRKRLELRLRLIRSK
jgi:hypothetical protein